MSADPPPVDLRGTAAADVAFTRFQRGRFRMWYARGIPQAEAESVWRAVVDRARGQELTAVLQWDEEVNLYYFDERVLADGSPWRKPASSLQAALTAREARLGERAATMRQALAAARPSRRHRETLAEKRKLIEEEGSPKEPTMALLVLGVPPSQAGVYFASGSELEPEGEELAIALAHWRKRHGAIPLAWTGYDLRLAVERPPAGLAELRALAWQFYLMCPAHPSGRTLRNEPADELLTRLQEERWVCSWFVE